MQNGVKHMGRNLAKAARRKLLHLLAPYLLLAAVILAAALLVIMLIAATYAAMAPQRALTGVDPSPEDAAIQQKYENLCDKYNVEDTWLVEGESSPERPFYPGRGVRNLHQMVDRYGNDQKLKLKWGMVHATALYWAYVKNKPEIPDDIREKATRDLHPYFYYKESSVTVCGKDGCETYDVYLLVEAYTIFGHYQYHYEWVTETYGEGENAVSVTYERLKDIRTLSEWKRLERYLKEFYGLKPDDDMALNRIMVVEAGKGFNEREEWLEWLLAQYSPSEYASEAMIPPDLLPYFKEAEQKYGIPWWFLAAVAFKESSFDPQAENPKTHCYGLMQVSPENWQHYAPLLGFDVDLDKNNPRAQIMVGAYMLKELGLGNVNWGAPDWKEQTLNELAFYGGFRGEKALERCREEYAEPIWELAERFRSPAAWPVPGHTAISSYFGWRKHPITGELKHHDGIDIPAPEGTPVVSISGGAVEHAGWQDPNDRGRGYGMYVKIMDGSHAYIYAHLSSIDVSAGWSVQPGQQIGAVGSTGRSTGAHLHFGVLDLEKNCWIDPLMVVRP